MAFKRYTYTGRAKNKKTHKKKNHRCDTAYAQTHTFRVKVNCNPPAAPAQSKAAGRPNTRSLMMRKERERERYGILIRKQTNRVDDSRDV